MRITGAISIGVLITQSNIYEERKTKFLVRKTVFGKNPSPYMFDLIPNTSNFFEFF